MEALGGLQTAVQMLPTAGVSWQLLRSQAERADAGGVGAGVGEPMDIGSLCLLLNSLLGPFGLFARPEQDIQEHRAAVSAFRQWHSALCNT